MKQLLLLAILTFSANIFATEYKAFKCKAIFSGYDVFLDTEDKTYARVQKTAPDLGEVYESRVISRGPVFTIFFVDDYGAQLLINAVDGGHQLRRVNKEDPTGTIIESELISDQISCQDLI